MRYLPDTGSHGLTSVDIFVYVGGICPAWPASTCFVLILNEQTCDSANAQIISRLFPGKVCNEGVQVSLLLNS